MKRLLAGITLGIFALSGAGCARVSARVVDKPRMDQKIAGNQGVIQGEPGGAPARKPTRKYVEIDVDLAGPGQVNPWAAKQKQEQTQELVVTAQEQAFEQTFEQTQTASFETALPPSPQKQRLPKPAFAKVAPPKMPGGSVPEPASYDTVEVEQTRQIEAQIYTVKKGDNLEKISDTVYGSSKHWKRIFEANKEALRTPDRIYVGQKLKIPSLGIEEKSQRAEAEFK